MNKRVSGFAIYNYGDELVGIFDETYTIKSVNGFFEFENQKHLEEFKNAIEDAFEIATGERCSIVPLDEIDEDELIL
jgi:hypothetical protein